MSRRRREMAAVMLPPAESPPPKTKVGEMPRGFELDGVWKKSIRMEYSSSWVGKECSGARR